MFMNMWVEEEEEEKRKKKNSCTVSLPLTGEAAIHESCNHSDC